ncbi:cytochrome P450 [Halomicrobium sp. LC1Hm]|uniref:cytochrome P450 n=1 Tax=Halomicrobium sp. LC1Hm TaxID=2610902 RepID=UPI0012A83830|nr:cytochrome P450 [Halomicrobium sp. LC1Hm]QGA81887.1 Cytochrome P450 [Halomicrobium sp. LC1Hm]
MTDAPPSPEGYPLVGHTPNYVTDAFGFIEEAVGTVGDCFRVTVLGVGDLYVLAHPDYIEQALVSERAAFTKGPDFEFAFGDGIISVTGEAWERQREVLESFFYPARIRSYAEEMVALTTARIERWESGDRISLHEQARALALENLMGTLFDRRLALDGDERLRRAANDLNAWFEPSSWALPGWVPTPARRRFKRARATLQDEAERLIAERREGERGDDLLSALVAAQESDEGTLTDAEIVDQVQTMLFAGHDTTGLAMTYALYHLGRAPELRERFHAELDAVLGDRDPTLSDVSELDVTERIVNEALRLYPPIHTIPRRTTRAVEVGGYRIPAGETVHLSLYAVHRDARYYDEPSAFRPSRWLERNPQSAGYAFAPFGAGPRVCLGRRFALLEATLVLATIGRRFELDPQSSLSLEPAMTTQPAGEVPAIVSER